MQTYEPRVLLTKIAFMQRCADLVRRNPFFVTGAVPLSRAPALVRKFRDLYLIGAQKDSRYRRKCAGLGNAQLLLWRPEAESAELVFVLFVSELGDHPARILERLRDAREPGGRLEVTGYELIRHTRAGSHRPAWTWRMTAATYQGWRDRVRACVRHRNALELRQAWYSLHRVPGFAAARAQGKRIRELVRTEYRRANGLTLPLATPRLRYIERTPSNAVPLSALLR